MAKDKAQEYILILSKAIYESRETHEKSIQQNCVKSSIITLSDFYEQYRCENAKINLEITPSEVMPSIPEFADIFKSFAQFPINLQKPKRPVSYKLERARSNLSESDTPSLSSSCDLCPATTTSLSSPQSASLKQTASKIYTDFKKFIQSLNQFVQEAQQVPINEKYNEKLKLLRTFAEQLEKLRPTPQACKPAFTDEEEGKLKMILKNLEELDSIRNNYKVFENLDVGISSPRMETIAQLINYLFTIVQ